MNATTSSLTPRRNLSVALAALLAAAGMSAGAVAVADTDRLGYSPATAADAAPESQDGASRPAGPRGLAAGLSGR